LNKELCPIPINGNNTEIINILAKTFIECLLFNLRIRNFI